MDRVVILAIAAAYAYAVASRAYLFVARRCRDVGARRPLFIVPAVLGFAVSAYLVPWIAKLEPPWSESPAGIFAILGKLLIVATLGLASVGALLGATFPRLFSQPDA